MYRLFLRAPFLILFHRLRYTGRSDVCHDLASFSSARPSLCFIFVREGNVRAVEMDSFRARIAAPAGTGAGF